MTKVLVATVKPFIPKSVQQIEEIAGEAGYEFVLLEKYADQYAFIDAVADVDAVAPVAVPDYVWANYLEDRDAPAAYWRIPCADHYLQVDEPEMIARILRTTLADDVVPSGIEGADCQALKIH